MPAWGAKIPPVLPMAPPARERPMRGHRARSSAPPAPSRALLAPLAFWSAASSWGCQVAGKATE